MIGGDLIFLPFGARPGAKADAGQGNGKGEQEHRQQRKDRRSDRLFAENVHEHIPFLPYSIGRPFRPVYGLSTGLASGDARNDGFCAVLLDLAHRRADGRMADML